MFISYRYLYRMGVVLIFMGYFVDDGRLSIIGVLVAVAALLSPIKPRAEWCLWK